MREFSSGSHPMVELVSPVVRGICDLLWKPSDEEGGLAEAISPQMQVFVHRLHLAGIPLLPGS